MGSLLYLLLSVGVFQNAGGTPYRRHKKTRGVRAPRVFN